MIINLLRLILGFVEFEAKGGFSERFLNLCTINGITLWNVINDGVKVKACTDIKSYKRIRKSAHNSGMRVRITAKHGLPFFVKNNKARVGILIGAVLAVSFLAFSSCVIWDVEISGNDYVKSEALLESLEKNGVRVGALKGDIDTVSIAENLLEEYPEISWASINIFGTKAALEVKENTKKPDIINSDKPTNVVARKDGQILLVQGYRGTNAVKEGDVVVKGDLLISGITLMADGSEKLVHSFGKVYANTISRFDGEEALKKDVKLLKNAGVNYKIYLLGLEIPLYFRCEGEELYSGCNRISGNDITLPFGISWIVFSEFEETEIILTEKQASLEALKKCVGEKRKEFCSDEEIQKIKYTEKLNSEKAVIYCEVRAKENIALEKDIYIESENE